MTEMDENSPFNAFKLCWDSIVQESWKFENKFFSAEHCKILDSRDSSFEVVENRLAYVYKYGYFNISFFEKCFSLFINECSGVVFPIENLKICSLSNGPGFDIIGLLNALCKSDKPLKCLPVFNAVNMHESWSELYKSLVCKAYKVCIAKSFVEYFHLNSTNINLIQGDIFSASTLSSEIKNCISNSNALLMVNVFASSKATPTVFESSLKEIFNLLQPESLIFFIGSKNNMKNFSKFTHLKQYVKCVFGPQKVTLTGQPIDEQICATIGVKPCDSGHAQFVVWQKRQELSQEEENVAQCKDDSDTTSEKSSESSIASCTETWNESKNTCLISEIWGKVTEGMLQNTKVKFIESVTSNLNKVKLNHSNDVKQQLENQPQSTLQSDFNNVSDLKTDTANPINNSLQENNTSLVENNPIIDGTIKKNSFFTDFPPPNPTLVKQPANDKSVTTPKKSKKNKAKSVNKTENKSLDKKNENNTLEKKIENKILENSKLSQNNSCENSIEIEKKLIFSQSQATNTENLNYSLNNVQPLLQRCDNLISKLEELTVGIKKEFRPKNPSIFDKTHFSNQQMENCKVVHHHCCCVKIVHSCCCRKICKH